MELSIITLNYKKPELTLDCLSSLYLQHKNELESDVFEVIVVDNKSDDGSVEVLEKEVKKHTYKNIHVIASKENNGFGAGNNLGVQSAKGDYIVFLNNDTQVLDQGLKNMVTYMKEHEEVGILGGQLHNANGSLQASTGKFYTPFFALMLLLGMQRFGLLDKSPKTIQKVDWVKGGLLMMKKSTFEKIGRFDEQIFMYTEDMELCYRARKMGIDSYFFPEVMIVHKEYGSTNRTFAIENIYKNLPYFYRKHRSAFELQCIISMMKLKAILFLTSGKIIHNQYLIQTYEKALNALR